MMPGAVSSLPCKRTKARKLLRPNEDLFAPPSAEIPAEGWNMSKRKPRPTRKERRTADSEIEPIEPRDAGRLRARLIAHCEREVVEAYRAALERAPGQDIIVHVLHPRSDVMAAQLADRGGHAGKGIVVATMTTEDTIEAVKDWIALDILEGIKDAPTGCLKILCIAHNGAALEVPGNDGG